MHGASVTSTGLKQSGKAGSSRHEGVPCKLKFLWDEILPKGSSVMYTSNKHKSIRKDIHTFLKANYLTKFVNIKSHDD